jgi:Fe2+ or Zn2+ uptake regulation protein
VRSEETRVADSHESLDVIVAAILRHVDAHPLAADSASGVAQWWLGPAHEKATREQVERALELLVARRQLRRVTLSDGTTLYSRTQSTRH